MKDVRICKRKKKRKKKTLKNAYFSNLSTFFLTAWFLLFFFSQIFFFLTSSLSNEEISRQKIFTCPHSFYDLLFYSSFCPPQGFIREIAWHRQDALDKSQRNNSECWIGRFEERAKRKQLKMADKGKAKKREKNVYRIIGYAK